MRYSKFPLVALALSVTTLSSCHFFRSTTPPAERPNGEFISADDIARSGTNNAWDLLRSRARAYEFSEDRYGKPRSIRTRRGRSTINMAFADTPMIVIDGARLIDLSALRDLSTQSIQSVELLGGIAGTAAQGTNASAGLIYIHTWEASSAQKSDTGKLVARK
jgi:hypothetical protein